VPTIEAGAEVWESLSVHERNELLRSLLAAVAVRAVGPGKRVAVPDRVRVFRYGADLRLPAGRNGSANGIVPLWADANAVDVLFVPSVEDAL
jgi:hypothetical protein